jgi:hypothetical protein
MLVGVTQRRPHSIALLQNLPLLSLAPVLAVAFFFISSYG